MSDLTTFSGEVSVKGQNSNIVEIVSTYLQNFVSLNTRLSYTRDFKDFFSFLNQQGIVVNQPREIKKSHVIMYRDFLRDGDYANLSINRKLSALSSLFKELINAQIIPFNPAQDVKRLKEVSLKDKTAFTNEEISKIIAIFDEKKLKELNDKAIILFLIYTGARVSEAMTVKVRDLGSQDGVPTVKLMGKGAKPRKIALHPTLHNTLMKLIRVREKEMDDYLFTSIRKNFKHQPMNRTSVLKKIKHYLQLAGLSDSRSCHSFRRTVISNLLEKKKRIEHVAEIMGHTNINTTKGYNTREMKKSEDPLLSLDF